MSDLIVINDTCHDCGCRLLDAANFCSHCGSPIAGLTLLTPQADLTAQAGHFPAYRPQVVIVPRTQVSLVERALDNRLCVVAILLVAGPIGLPALWFSPCFSRRAKIISTVAYFLLTAILPLVAIWYFLEISLRPLLHVFNR